MPTRVLDPAFHELLQRRLIATFGTENSDGTIHLTAVWFLFEGGHFFIATSSKTRKAQNVVERPNTSLMVDVRKPGSEREPHGRLPCRTHFWRSLEGTQPPYSQPLSQSGRHRRSVNRSGLRVVRRRHDSIHAGFMVHMGHGYARCASLRWETGPNPGYLLPLD